MASKKKISVYDAIGGYLFSKKIGSRVTTKEIQDYVLEVSDTKANRSSIARRIRYAKKAGYLETISRGVFRLVRKDASSKSMAKEIRKADMGVSFEAKEDVEAAIFKRDLRCVFCNKDMTLVHHVNAKSVPTITMKNLEWGVACCNRCNNLIDDLTPEEYVKLEFNRQMTAFKNTKNPMLTKLANVMEHMIKILEEE